MSSPLDMSKTWSISHEKFEPSEGRIVGTANAIKISLNDFVYEGKYWRGSVWLPTAYATLRGLTRYGYHTEAQKIASTLVEHMCRTYFEYEPHTIWECYSPSEYKPAMQTDNKTVVRPDFCGWSALGPIAIYIENVL